jgi:hypothetical protein
MHLILSLSKDAPMLAQAAFFLSRSAATRRSVRAVELPGHRMDCHAAFGGSQ